MYNRNRLYIYITVFVLTAMLISLLTVYATASVGRARPSVSARAAVLYEAESGSFLYEKDADLRLPMASTTKIMTALVVAEVAEKSEEVVIDARAVGTEGSSAYLREGDVYTVEELLYALLLQSANDAAVALACHVGGSVPAFAEMMNARAEELSLVDTHFENPHGLDSEEHYTTARELSVIAAEALKRDDLRDIVATYKKTFIREERRRTYVNHNKLLRLVDGAVGVKTGYTKTAGRCLVGAAERNGLTFITVTLDDPCDWSDHEALFDYGATRLQRVVLCEAGEYVYRLPTTDGNGDSIVVSNTEGASVILPTGDYDIDARVRLPRFVTAPIREGEMLGEINFTINGEYAATVTLSAAQSLERARGGGFFKKILSFIR